MKIAKIMFILAAFTIFVISCTQNETPESKTANNSAVTNTSVDDSNTNAEPKEAVTGKSIYAESCAKCHKDDGSGGSVDVDGKTWKAKNLVSEGMKKDSDEEFIEHITEGIPDEGMPAFKDKLSAEEIKLVVKYIREELQKS